MLYRRPKRDRSIWIDLSPLIDVVFLLLIFFMVSTRFKDDYGLELDLPSSESRSGEQTENITILVGGDGAIRLGEAEVAVDDLRDAIEKMLPDYENKMVVLKVDESVSHGTVVAVMDAAKSAGAEGLTFSTKGKPARPDLNDPN